MNVEEEAAAHLRAERERLHLLEAIVSALDRRAEVVETIGSSVDVEQSREALRELLEVDELGAMAVLDLQLRRFSEVQRTKIAEDRDDLLARVESGIGYAGSYEYLDDDEEWEDDAWPDGEGAEGALPGCFVCTDSALALILAVTKDGDGVTISVPLEFRLCRSCADAAAAGDVRALSQRVAGFLQGESAVENVVPLLTDTLRD